MHMLQFDSVRRGRCKPVMIAHEHPQWPALGDMDRGALRGRGRAKRDEPAAKQAGDDRRRGVDSPNGATTLTRLLLCQSD